MLAGRAGRYCVDGSAFYEVEHFSVDLFAQPQRPFCRAFGRFRGAPRLTTRLVLGLSFALLHHESYVLRTRCAIDGKLPVITPGNEFVDINVHFFNSRAFTLDNSESIESASFPLFKSIVKLVSIINNFRKAMPLCAIEPRKTHDNIAIRPGL
jgi:hypothetical protein